MLSLRALLGLALLNCALSNSTTPSNYQMEYGEGSSIEAKYLLPSVNVSVEDDFSGNRSVHAVRATLARILDFYNTELLAINWDRFKAGLTSGCQKDVETYIKGLGKAENWALKMDDASGKYSTGWFWGNMYWIGSRHLCEHIAPNQNIVINSQNVSRVVRAASLRPSSPGVPLGYEAGPIVYTSRPPFPISFYTLRLHLNSSFTREEKIVHVGLCLPHACSAEDVRKIMEGTSATSTEITVDVEAVRSEHNKFNILEDSTFLALCVTTFIVIILLIAGTWFDFYLSKSKIKAKNCARFSANIDMSMPDIKTKNGKCALYVVNNNNNSNNNNTFYNNSDGRLHSLESNSGKNESKTEEPLSRIILKEMLLSFSIYKNLSHICDKTVGSDTIPVIHGLKAITMAWVILGHTCIIVFKYSDNMEFRKVVQKEFMFQTIINGTFSVDTFFFASGLLVSFLYFRTNAKGKLNPLNKGNTFIAGVLHFIGLVAYRFARLTAPYLFAVGIVELSTKWFHYNSVFEAPAMDHVNCPNYWWRNVLYINTLFPVEEMCMLWSWYLSDDTQFFVLGAVMLIIATSHFKSAIALLTTFLMSSWITTAYIAYSNSHIPGSDDPLALFDKIYDKPWTRFGPYLVGMCTGWYLFKKNCKIHMSKLTITIGWAAAIALLLALVYGLYEVRLAPWAGAAYSSLSHSAWAIGLGWIVVACVTGYGGIVNKILSASILYPFSRVTYCAYLIHPIAIRVMIMSMDSPLHLGSIIMAVIYMGQFVISYILAFFISLSFEAPMVSLLRIIPKVVAILKNRSAVSTS